jgi:hypothetical protein
MQDLRSLMVDKTERMLLESRTQNDPNWHAALPRMARLLDRLLYERARTVEEYADESTLRERTKRVEADIRKRS